MQLTVPEIFYTLAKNVPFPLYAVGGAVRDTLANLPSSNDWDLCAPVSAEFFSAHAEKCGFTVKGVYKTTGTVNLSAENLKIEFTSFRTDVYRRGEHAPAKICFTNDILADAKRRDFKCNAVYWDLKTGEIVDPLGGTAEIESRTLSTTRDADEVFSEDGLRLMRLARLSAQLGFTPTLECIFGAKFNAARIQKISAERIYFELCQILHADEKYNLQYAQYNGLKLLEGTDVLNYILPELAAGKGMPQRKDFHDHDVLEHSFRACKYADPRVRLTALLHDAGKPYMFSLTGKFHNHDAEGERIVRAVLERLKAPKKTTDTVCRLTRLHMYDLDGKVREGKIRRFLVENADIYPLLALVKQADYSGCKDDLSTCPTLLKWEKIRKKMVSEGVPFSLKELAVKGNDLKDVVPAKYISKLLHELLLLCAQNGAQNNRTALLSAAEKLAKEICHD